ncbi:MAG: hypothetical protein ACQZ2J_27715 [Pseudomonas piscis]|uniref:hypothetical protein n=1 Tax=Pseudomonas piscis TaxID=2614538 RepID=UPI003D2B6083
MPHDLDVPVVHKHRGQTVFLKFEWDRPNDDVPAAVRVIQANQLHGVGDVAAELRGPWPGYQAALDEGIEAAERWINSQLP